MIVLISITGAIFVAAACYGTIYAVDQKRDLALRKRGKLITSYFVAAVETASICMLVWLGIKGIGRLALPVLLLQYVLLWGMSVLAVTDYKKQIIPNQILLMLLFIWIGIIGIYMIAAMEYGLALFFQSLLGGIVGGLIFVLCYLFSKGQLGAGDVKLAFIMGLYLTGQRIVGAVFYGVMLCLLYSIVQLLRRKVGLKDGVPLAPFLYAGVLLTLLIMF